MPTSRGPVSLRLHDNAPRAAAPGESTFMIAAPDGRLLLDASIDRLPTRGPARLASSRRRSAVVALVALTVLLLAGPLLDARAAARAPRREMQVTFTIVAVIVVGTALLAVAFAVSPWAAVTGDRKAFKLLLGGLASAAIVATLVSAARPPAGRAAGPAPRSRGNRWRYLSPCSSPAACSSRPCWSCSSVCSAAASIRRRWTCGISPCTRGPAPASRR